MFAYTPKSPGNDATRQIVTREANFANQPAALRWHQRPSPAVCGGLLRRPQRPGNQCAPRRASGGTLPTIHPRELSGTAGSAAMLWQGMQESRLNDDTVRYRWGRHQEKTRAALCRNCECQKFFVESKGKPDNNLPSRSGQSSVHHSSNNHQNVGDDRVPKFCQPMTQTEVCRVRHGMTYRRDALLISARLHTR